jgi:hypothetical protein
MFETILDGSGWLVEVDPASRIPAAAVVAGPAFFLAVETPGAEETSTGEEVCPDSHPVSKAIVPSEIAADFRWNEAQRFVSRLIGMNEDSWLFVSSGDVPTMNR